MGMAGALALTLMFSQAPQAPATTGAVSGRVTIEGSNTPVAGARIVLFPNGPIGQRGSAPRIGPMRPPETPTSPIWPRLPVPSNTVAPRMIRSMEQERNSVAIAPCQN